MARCEAFYERWKKDPNWCEKSPDQVRLIDHFLILVGEVVEAGADQAAVYKKLPEGTARLVFPLKGEVREKTIKLIANKIGRGEKIVASDIRVWAGIEKTNPEKSGKPTIVGSGSSEPSVKPESSESVTPASPDASTIVDSLKDQAAKFIWSPEYQEKRPITWACHEAGCIHLMLVKVGLHTCLLTGMRPENMNGKIPPGCPKTAAPEYTTGYKAPLHIPGGKVAGWNEETKFFGGIKPAIQDCRQCSDHPAEGEHCAECHPAEGEVPDDEPAVKPHPRTMEGGDAAIEDIVADLIRRGLMSKGQLATLKNDVVEENSEDLRAAFMSMIQLGITQMELQQGGEP